MCTAEYNIKVVEGNEFLLVLPLKKRTYVASVPIDEDIDATALVGCVVKIGDVEYTPTLDEDGVKVLVPATLARDTYDIIVTATYHGSAIRAAYFDALTIVAWNEQSNAQQYIQGSPVVAQAAYVIGGTLTDAELESLKAEYRLKIAAAEEAKEAADAAKQAYDTKAEALDDIAQQSTLTQGVSDIREDISHISIDTSTLAKQGNNESANLTATQTAATNAYASAEAAKIAAQAITGYATEANATANKNAILDKIGAPASGQSATLFSAIGDVALSAQTLQSLADSWAAMVTNKNRLDGYVFLQGVDINSPYDLIRRKSDLEYVDDTALQVYVGGGSVLSSTVLKSIKFREVLRIESGSSDMRGCSMLESIEFPKLYSFAQNNWCISQNPELKKLYMPELYLFSGATPYPTYGCPKLIDITIGAFSVNPNFLSAWDPTIALDSSSSSLVEEGETFTNNREKLLYNIREHIAARLADMTGVGKTITFSSNVKAAINADTATANAFTSKGWTIA